ncbi:MAG: cytochrome-c peroxidase [Saprospiraceae bacterium]|nr:cytochrome-c peroxidase [Saprospiraceae bacterium]
MRISIVATLAVMLLFLVQCKRSDSSAPDGADARPQQVRVRFDALPEQVKAPAHNPTSPAKVELGRLLFFDPILSGNEDVACATCHHPTSGYAESLEISIGVNGHGFGASRSFLQPNDIPFTKRNSPTVLNTAYNGIDIYQDYEPDVAPMFWDLRKNSLEGQALEPIKALEEMRGRKYEEDEILGVVIDRLRANDTYQKLFQAAFRGTEAISEENLAKALAAFERTLVTNQSRFDKYMRGDKSALSLSEIEGFEAFKKAGCGNCHNGPMFSDFKVHVLGTAPSTKLSETDRGFEDRFAFRTPTLRNLRFTFPYMHNGSISSLKKVLEFYEDISNGKSRHAEVSAEDLDPLVKELDVDVGNMDQIVNFLHCLNDEDFDRSIPESVPSGLSVGGNIAQ